MKKTFCRRAEFPVGFGRIAMNKLGVHALVWVGGWSHDECEQAIAQTAELGYDLIEIPALDPGDRRRFHAPHARGNTLGVTMSLGLDADRHLQRRSGQGQARRSAAGCDASRSRATSARPTSAASSIPRSRNTSCRRPSTASRARSTCCAALARSGREERHHDRPGGRQPLREQRAEHRGPGGGVLRAASARPTSRSTSTPTT